MDNNLKKTYLWNTLGSGFNSVNSLFLLMAVTRINGLDKAGIFTLAYASACILYIVATYCGRTYQVTDVNKQIHDKDFISSRIVSISIMFIFALFFALINGFDKTKFTVLILLCIGKAVEALSDIYHGILQKNKRLDLVGISLFIRSFLVITSFVICDIITKNLILSIILMIIINSLVLIFIDIKKSLCYLENKKASKASVFKIFTLGFYTFAISFMANYLVNVSRYAINAVMNEKFQTIFGIIVMPATMIMLLNQFIIQPVIIIMKNEYLDKHKVGFIKIIVKVILATIILSIVVIVVAYFIGIPVLNFLYGIKLDKYLYDLLLILVGATIYTIATILSNGLIVLRKTKGQFFIYLISLIFAFLVSYKLVNIMGFNGAIYSYLLSMILLLVLYIIYFIVIVNKENIWK